jgi:uncharacterized protein DUF4114
MGDDARRHRRRARVRDRELGGLLLPHVRRAVTISNVLDVQTIERANISEALNALRIAPGVRAPAKDLTDSFGFEDLPASRGSDFDFNDLVVRVTLVADRH